MKWSELPARYKAAEIGAVGVTTVGLVTTLITDLAYGTNYTNPKNITEFGASGLILGYLAGGTCDLMDGVWNFVSSPNRSWNKRKGKLEEKVN